MSTASGSNESKLSLHDKIWNFDVSDPRLHPQGFTVYKVTCRFFAIDRPESLTVIVTWKRYNDFKNLYKAMVTLHKALHRRDTFPVFAKPKVFGRFDDAVVEERRQSALALLNFIGTQPHLYKSQALAQFLSDGKVDSTKPALLSPQSANNDGTKPATLVPLIVGSDSTSKAASVSSQQSLGYGKNVGLPASSLTVASSGSAPPSGSGQESQGDSSESVSQSDGDSSLQQSLEASVPKPLEGTWNFPQVPDSISLDSSSMGDDDTDTGEMDSILSSSLPDADMSMFDPLRPENTPVDGVDGIGSMPRTNSWLTEAISTCARMDDTASAAMDSASADVTAQSDHFTIGDGNLSVPFDTKSPSHHSDHSLTGSVEMWKSSGGSLVEVGLGDENFVPPEIGGRESRSESKVSCGKGDIDLSSVGSNRSQSVSSTTASSSSAFSTPSHAARGISAVDSPSGKAAHSASPSLKVPVASGLVPSDSPSGSLGRSPVQSPGKARSATASSVSTMDLGGKEDYIYLAAGQICLAQNSEATGQYQLAFSYYKTGVGILLQGVQGDTNKARRDAVRRKTAQYLMKAEDLYNRHLASENLDERRWAADSYVSPSLELDPSFAFIRGSARELRNYQVLGTLDKNVLVLDRSTEETFVIKTIQKLATGAAGADLTQRSILPTTCPYMVTMHRFFETDSAIFLLLQYASGGRLWSYIAGYLQQTGGHGNALGDGHYLQGTVAGNVYMGQKMHVDSNAAPVDKSAGSSKSAEKKDSSKKPVLSEAGIRFSELRAAVISPDDDVSGTLKAADEEELEQEKSVIELDKCLQRDVHSTFEEDSSSAQRLSSLSSDEFVRSVSQEEEENKEKLSKRLSSGEGTDQFHDLLQQSKVTLENFSINSFDSDTARLSSSFAGNDVPADLDPSSGSAFSPHSRLGPLSTIPDEVFSDLPSSSSPEEQKEHGPEVSDMLESSRELLRSVERTLSQVEEEDCSVSKDSVTPQTSEDTSQKDYSKTDSNESPEISIYDSHKQSDDEYADISAATDSVALSDTAEAALMGKSPPQHVENGVQHKDQDQFPKSKPSEDLRDVPSELLLDGGIVMSKADSPILSSQSDEVAGSTNAVKPSQSTRQRSISGTSQHSDVTVPRKVTFTRSTSGDMTRSASFECDLKSPTRHRGRIVSDLFEQLDGECPEHVVLPESIVQRWAAEIVIAVSRLHGLGIICRDLKPDNILLGEGGHIFLTYFCQVGQLEKEIDWNAVEQMYVAPEVRSIGGYDAACDWWSLGALLYELLVGKSLMMCHPEGILPYTNIFIPSHVSSEGRSLLQDLLRYNPRERLGAGMAGAEEIKAHNFFSGIDWNTLEYV